MQIVMSTRRKIFFLLVVFFSLSSFAQDILPFKTIFKPIVLQEKVGDLYQVNIKINIPRDYYLYKRKLSVEGAEQYEKVEKSKGIEEDDEYFGLVKIYDYDHPAQITVFSHQAVKQIALHAQGCRKNVICYPPDQWVLDVASGTSLNDKPTQSFNSHLLNQNSYVSGVSNSMTSRQSSVLIQNKQQESAQNVSLEKSVLAVSGFNENTQIATTFADEKITQQLSNNFLYALLVVFLLGILISFTACVYPMIPIISSLVVGRETSHKKSFLLTLTYIFGIAFALALLGVLVGSLNFNIQQYFQKVWIVILAALFFFVLALSMFDFFTLNMPSGLQGKIDKIVRKQRTGSYMGAMIMGALSILVVSPCATPVLAGLLGYASSANVSAFRAAVALFVFGLGMGMPLLIFSTALRHIMPKAGNWMIFIKKGLAFFMLGIAIWIIVRIFPQEWLWLMYLIWSLYALLITTALEISIQQSVDKAFILRFLRYVAIVFSLMLGVFAYSNYAITPLMHNNRALVSAQKLFDEDIESSEQLQDFITGSNKPAIVDFYADWCVECKIWERKIWNNPQFSTIFSQFNLVKIDVTQMTDTHRELFKQLNIFGPPVVLIYQPGTKINQPLQKIIGEMPAEDFLKILTKIRSKISVRI